VKCWGGENWGKPFWDKKTGRSIIHENSSGLKRSKWKKSLETILWGWVSLVWKKTKGGNKREIKGKKKTKGVHKGT